MESRIGLQDISLRIKYESFAKLTSELNTAQSLDAIAQVLRIHLKYVFNFTHYRLLIFYKSQKLLFNVTRQRGTFINNIDEIYPMEWEAIRKNVPVVLDGNHLINNPDKYHPQSQGLGLKHICLYPVRANEDQFILICAAGTSEKTFNESDFRFLRLVGEFMLSKVSQIILTDQLEEMVEKRTEQLNAVNQELSTLFYRSSHDLNSPFTSLQGLLELSRLQITKPPELSLLFDHIDHVISQAQAMLQKLKAISEADLLVQQARQINLHDFALSIISHHKPEAAKKGINIFYVLSGDEQVIFSDQVLSILLNSFMENAVQYHRNISGCFVKLNIHATPVSITCSVEDNGQGIHPDKVASIFDMYSRSNDNSKGSGLGLYMVKKIAEKLNADVRVTSQLHEGTKFTLAVPVSPAAALYQ